MSRTLLDITLPISPRLPVWPGDQPVELAFSRGELPRVTRVGLTSHTGTHLDAPAHFFADGATTDAWPLDVLIGAATVVCSQGSGPVTSEWLGDHVPPGATRLLIRTDNSARSQTAFDPNYVALAADAAAWLVARGVRLVGIDAPSVDLFTADDYPAHRALLAAGIVVIENLALANVDPGAYDLLCLPLRLADSDGAPARVVLVRDA